MPPLTRAKNFLDFGHTTVLKRDDGIVEITCGEDTHYEPQHMFEMHAASSRLLNKQRVPILFMVGKFTSISQEGMKYGATDEATVLSKAEAYVIHSMAQRILANFYMRIHKPNVPTRFFDNKEKAEEWLKEFV